MVHNHAFEQLIKYAKSIVRTNLRDLTISILHDCKPALVSKVGSDREHHYFKGGLLIHLLSVAQVCNFLCKRFTSFDRDLVIAGALLHDVGKIYDYDGPKKKIEDNRYFLGHAYEGARLVESYIEKDGSFSAELKNSILHLVLFHMNPKDEVLLPELHVVKFADEMDSYCESIETRLSNTDSGDWTPIIPMLGKKLFKTPAK